MKRYRVKAEVIQEFPCYDRYIESIELYAEDKWRAHEEALNILMFERHLRIVSLIGCKEVEK